ncbi:hypothetical protein ROHU_034311 [Labeo rohita]|uniref:Uncharacterized protein n=1 Tax=Labeo rohita TaxID=84645 RepID=A0A498LE22_LABRO|nr:hypothetical protein ROHU_034311 [Labeo rohita]
MEGQETQPLPPAPDNAGKEEDMETETSEDDGAPMGNADEQQKCTMCGLRLNFLKDNDSKSHHAAAVSSPDLDMKNINARTSGNKTCAGNSCGIYMLMYLYILSINIHRGRRAIDSPVVVHSVDGEVLPRRV